MERAQTKPGTALLPVSLLVALLSACTSSPDASDGDQSAIEAPAATTSTTSATAIDNTEAAMVTAARRQLEARLGDGGAATIRTEAFARVVWPNGAIGCPKPGRSFTMALVPGYQVVLEADGRLYHYHGREGQAPFYCARPQGQGGWEMDR